VAEGIEGWREVFHGAIDTPEGKMRIVAFVNKKQKTDDKQPILRIYKAREKAASEQRIRQRRYSRRWAMDDTLREKIACLIGKRTLSWPIPYKYTWKEHRSIYAWLIVSSVSFARRRR